MSKLIETHVGVASLQRTDRKTLAISVHPDGSLELVAPRESTDEAILAKVRKRSRWISTQRRLFREMNATRGPRRFVSGATQRYLGKQYRLKVQLGEVPSVRLKGAYFIVVSPTGQPEEVQKLMQQWFREKAKEQFARRIKSWHPWCRRHQLPEPKLVLRLMAKRWGSASPNGRIALNPELIHVPSPCIDYVIAHEICHLMHTSHDPKFYRLLASLVPNWKRQKERLERAELA